MKNPNKSGFSIVIGMGLVIVATLAAYFILSFTVPFAKNIKGIENSSSSYYNSYGGIEDSMYFVNKERTAITTEKTSTSGTSTGYTFTTSSSGNIIPLPGQGTSDFDADYDAISSLEPIQLQVGGLGNIWDTQVKFYFKVPDLDPISTVSLSGGTYNIINWTLISPTDTLITTSGYIKSDEIRKSKDYSPLINNLGQRDGENLYGSGMKFSDFYNANCTTDCILKMSIISDLYSNDIIKKQLPSISYKIDFGSIKAPLRYTTIKSIGKSYGFRKDLEIKVPQQTVPQAFDFTVFQ